PLDPSSSLAGPGVFSSLAGSGVADRHSITVDRCVIGVLSAQNPDNATVEAGTPQVGAGGRGWAWGGGGWARGAAGPGADRRARRAPMAMPDMPALAAPLRARAGSPGTLGSLVAGFADMPL